MKTVMNTQSLSNKLNGMNIQQAKHFIESLSGLNIIEKKYEYPYQVCYSVADHREICLITATQADLNSPAIKATYCFKD